MTAGYVINDGEEYYCSDDCLHSAYSTEEYEELCQMDLAYWTQWEEGRKEMIGKCDFDAIKAQSDFCELLMTRLHGEIETSGEGLWSGMENHNRKQDDIKRIRRELLTLSKMLDPWGE